MSARVLVACGFTIVLLTASLARAQPWVDEPGSVAADLSYQFGTTSGVVLDPDSPILESPTRSHTFALGAEYVVIEHLAVDASIPLVAIKYLTPAIVHPPMPGAWDDGSTHVALQDFRLNARYAVLEEPLAIAPRIGFTIPIMDYETNGFAAIGRHLIQGHFALHIGRTLDPILPDLYITAGYEFTLSEKFNQSTETAAVNQNRSDIEAEIGYLLLEGKLALSVDFSWRIPHGGVSFANFDTLPMDQQNYHDPLLAEKFIYLGGGVAYSIIDELSVGVFARFFLRGYDTRDQNLFGLSVGWQIR